MRDFLIQGDVSVSAYLAFRHAGFSARQVLANYTLSDVVGIGSLRGQREYFGTAFSICW